MQGIALAYLASRRRHPGLWQVIDLIAGFGMVAILWLLIGPTVGIVSAILWAVLMAVGFVVYLVRRHAAG